MTKRTQTVGDIVQRLGVEDTLHTALDKLTKGDGARMFNVLARLSTWRFTVSARATTRWGICRSTRETIELNAVLLQHPTDFRLIFLHEVAHAIDYLLHGRTCGHGARWQRIMACLGERVKAPHTADAIEAIKGVRAARARETWACARCGATVAIMKRRKYPASQYTHPTCGGSFKVI